MPRRPRTHFRRRLGPRPPVVASFATGPCGREESLFAAERDAGVLSGRTPVFLSRGDWRDWDDHYIYAQLFLMQVFRLRSVRSHMAALSLRRGDHRLMKPEYQRGWMAFEHFWSRPKSMDSAAMVLAWAMQPCPFISGDARTAENRLAAVHETLRREIITYFNEDEWKLLSTYVRKSGHLHAVLLSRF